MAITSNDASTDYSQLLEIIEKRTKNLKERLSEGSKEIKEPAKEKKEVIKSKKKYISYMFKVASVLFVCALCFSLLFIPVPDFYEAICILVQEIFKVSIIGDSPEMANIIH